MINAYETSGSSPGRKIALTSTVSIFSIPIFTSQDAACHSSLFIITNLIKQVDIPLRVSPLSGKVYGDTSDADLIDAYCTSGNSPGHQHAPTGTESARNPASPLPSKKAVDGGAA